MPCDLHQLQNSLKPGSSLMSILGQDSSDGDYLERSTYALRGIPRSRQTCARWQQRSLACRGNHPYSTVTIGMLPRGQQLTGRSNVLQESPSYLPSVSLCQNQDYRSSLKIKCVFKKMPGHHFVWCSWLDKSGALMNSKAYNRLNRASLLYRPFETGVSNRSRFPM